jgi:hypothetical protein
MRLPSYGKGSCFYEWHYLVPVSDRQGNSPMKIYTITIIALVRANSQPEAEKIALEAVDDYRGTEAYINNNAISGALLYTVAPGDELPTINMPDR